MENFILYLIRATICLAVFGIFFRLLLLKETFFRFTRFVLLTGLVVCSVLPLITIKIKAPAPSSFLLEEYLPGYKALKNESHQIGEQNYQHITPAQPEQSLQTVDRTMKNNPFNWFNLMIFIYWAGVGMMIIRLAISFLHLNKLIKSNKSVNHNGLKLVICSNDIAPFSFFRHIVISEKDYDNNAEEIILHEKIHIRKKHNLDLIPAELLLIFHWFNPIVWMLGRDLREIHEYETDHEVIESGISAQNYQLLLIRKAVGEKRFSAVVNSFNQSKLKNRITMMLKIKSTPRARLKALFVVPAVVFALFVFAKNEPTDPPERKAIATSFLQLKEAEKGNNITAFFYMNQNKQLFMMYDTDPEAVIKSFDLNKRSDFKKSLVEIIDQHVRNNQSKVIKIIIAAEKETQMESISILKNEMRKAFLEWKGTISEDDKELYNLSQLITLSVKYAPYPYQKELTVFKQINQNPLYFWETFQSYYSVRGISPQKPGQTSKSEMKNIIPVLINNLNQVKIRNYTISNPNEIVTESNIEAVKSIIVNEWEKRNEGLITKGTPLFLVLQHDITTNSDAIMQTAKVLLPVAYDDAIEEIARRESADIQNIQKQMQLLLLNSKYSITFPPPPPPPSLSTEKANNTVSEREKLIRSGSKLFSFHSVSGISKENQFAFFEVVDNGFPNELQNILDFRKKNYSTIALNDLSVTLADDISTEEIKTINQTINQSLTVNNLIFLPMFQF